MLVSLGPIAVQAQTAASEIDWHNDAAAAIEAAQKLGRPIVVFVTSDHCGYCRKMERDTWSDIRIRQRLSSEYVALRVNADASPDTVRRLRIRAFPTTMRFSPGGEYQDGFAGFVDAEKLSKYLSSDRR